MSACLLVADDDAVARDLLGEVLIHEGYQVLPASDGAEALTLCSTGSRCSGASPPSGPAFPW